MISVSSPRSTWGSVPPPEGWETTRSGSKLPSNSSRLLRRRKQKKRSPRMRIKAIPPTTPPTIAPVFDELFVVVGEVVEMGIEVVVDISVVTTIVDP